MTAPEKEQILLMLESPVSSMGRDLNAHHPVFLHEGFEPTEARRIAKGRRSTTRQNTGVAFVWTRSSRGTGLAVPEPLDTRHGSYWVRIRSMAEPARLGRNSKGLGLRQRKCPHQGQVSLPVSIQR